MTGNVKESDFKLAYHLQLHCLLQSGVTSLHWCYCFCGKNTKLIFDINAHRCRSTVSVIDIIAHEKLYIQG